MNRSYSPTLVIDEDGAGPAIACRACRHRLAGASESWKEHAVLHEAPLREAGGPVYDTGDDAVVLRRFYCPACGAALDTETAVIGEPFLIDRLGP